MCSVNNNIYMYTYYTLGIWWMLNLHKNRGFSCKIRVQFTKELPINREIHVQIILRSFLFPYIKVFQNLTLIYQKVCAVKLNLRNQKKFAMVSLFYKPYSPDHHQNIWIWIKRGASNLILRIFAFMDQERYSRPAFDIPERSAANDF